METKFNDNLTGLNEKAPNINRPLKFLTASSVIGDKVVNKEGENMGSIKDVMLDIRDGKIEYYIIEFGGFLGLGEKCFAIPFKLLAVDPDNKIFVFNEKQETLKKAPGFDKTHWPETNYHSDYVTDSWSFWS